MRLPSAAWIDGDVFKDTFWFARECKDPENKTGGEVPKIKITNLSDAIAAADDPSIGTGTSAYPKLRVNIWSYFDRMSREERIRAMTHAFHITGEIDGAGWATVEIELDDYSSRFRISYIGKSIYDFRQWVEELEDGENDYFGWESEPGWYEWKIQRRGGVLYVAAPEREDSIFIPLSTFLEATEDLTDCW